MPHFHYQQKSFWKEGVCSSRPLCSFLSVGCKGCFMAVPARQYFQQGSAGLHMHRRKSHECLCKTFIFVTLHRNWGFIFIWVRVLVAISWWLKSKSRAVLIIMLSKLYVWLILTPDIEICGQNLTQNPSKPVRVLLSIGGLRFYRYWQIFCLTWLTNWQENKGISV